MSNYEIMILVNPQSTDEQVQKLLLSVLPENNTKIERLERTELAYPIKKTSRAIYYLIHTKIDPQLTSELTRRLNIEKSVLRTLIINLDSEKGLKPKKMRRKRVRRINNKDGNKKPYVKREDKNNNGERKIRTRKNEKE